MTDAVDWDGAVKRRADLMRLFAHLERVPVLGAWRVAAAIAVEVATIPHPNWLRAPRVVEEDD